MRLKQTVCLMLSITMVMSVLAGCQAESADGSNPPVATLAPDDTLEFDTTLENIRVVVDGIVHNFDVQVADGSWYISAQDAQTAFGGAFTEEYVDLDAYARTADIRYTQDIVLTAAYFSTFEGYSAAVSSPDFERAFTLGLVSQEYRARASEQISSTQFRAMLADLIERLAPNQMAAFDRNVTNVEKPMTRGLGFLMAFYCAECIGADYFNNDFNNNLVDTEDLWSIDPADYAALFPHAEEGPVRVGKQGQAKEDCQEWAEYIAASFLWSFWHSSPVSGEQMFSFDEAAGSMHQREALTVEDAVCAVTRLYDTVESAAFAAITDAAAVSVNRDILTPELLEQAKAAPAVTAENHPIWTGLVFGQEYSALLVDATDRIRQAADWGFNSVRLKVDYEALFNGDVTAANLTALEILDKSVAVAIQNHLHLDLCLTSLPGRTVMVHSDFSSEADLDLFTNPEKQELANRVWTVLAQRYQEIPSAYLSFTPFWELFGKSLSTGLPEPEYTMSDAGRYLANVIDVIRGQDHDRLIIAEVAGYPSGDIADASADASAVLAELGERENIIVSFNFVEGRYVYAHMTATPGEHIDFSTHSNFLAEYPTYYYSLSPYIIDMDAHMETVMDDFVNWGAPDRKDLTLEGCLPEGTVIELYLSQSYGGTLSFSADGEKIYEEGLSRVAYNTSSFASPYFPYATSDKPVRVVLTRDVDQLVISVDGGALEWCGMNVILPEAYAQDRWYQVTDYDVFLGLAEETGIMKRSTSTIVIAPYPGKDFCHRITVHEDLSYSTEELLMSAEEDTIRAAIEAAAQIGPGGVVRFENAAFSAVTAESMFGYYEDVLRALTDNGFSWWSNDWHSLVGDAPIAGAEYTKYQGSAANLYVELLRLLQQYQNSERP